MKIEFLILKNEDKNCNTINTLKSFINSNAELKVHNKIMSYNKFEVTFKLKTDLINNLSKNERYFLLTIERSSLTKMIQQKKEHYKNFKKDFENIIKFKRFFKCLLEDSNYGFKVIILWDDTSYYYARISYPLINEIENLMRKLIYKFMFLNIGMNWLSNALPKDLENEIKRNIKRDDNERNIIQESLYSADFIKLKNLLFDNYCNSNTDKIYKKLNNAHRNSELDLNELKEIIPKSNWDRYFSKYINIDNLDKKWDELYELRNKIAHNKIINKGDYEKIVKLTNDIKKSLIIAIDKLDIITINENEKKDISFANLLISYSNLARIAGNPIFNQYKLDDLISINFDYNKTIGDIIKQAFDVCEQEIKSKSDDDKKTVDDGNDNKKIKDK